MSRRSNSCDGFSPPRHEGTIARLIASILFHLGLIRVNDNCHRVGRLNLGL